MTFRTITGEFRDITGELLANTTIDVTPKYHISGDGSSVAILGDTTPVTSNGSGVATVNLADNILYEIEYTTSRGTQSREMFVDDEGPWAWGRLIGLAGNIGASILRQASDIVDLDTRVPVLTITADKTIAPDDAGKLTVVDSANERTITVPTHASDPIVVGSVFEIARYGAGNVIIAFASGVSVLCPHEARSLPQYGRASLVKYANDEWFLSGDLI